MLKMRKLAEEALRVHAYVTGPSGAGKTTFVNREYPEDKFYHLHSDAYKRVEMTPEGPVRYFNWGRATRDAKASGKPVVVDSLNIHEPLARAAEHKILLDIPEEESLRRRHERNLHEFDRDTKEGSKTYEHFDKNMRPLAERLGFKADSTMRPKIAHLLQKLAESPEDYIGGAVKIARGENAPINIEDLDAVYDYIDQHGFAGDRRRFSGIRPFFKKHGPAIVKGLKKAAKPAAIVVGTGGLVYAGDAALRHFAPDVPGKEKVAVSKEMLNRAIGTAKGQAEELENLKSTVSPENAALRENLAKRKATQIEKFTKALSTPGRPEHPSPPRLMSPFAKKALIGGGIGLGLAGAYHLYNRHKQQTMPKYGASGILKTADAPSLETAKEMARGLPGLLTWHYMTGPHLERAKRLHVLRMKAVNEGWPAGEAMEIEREHRGG